MLFLQSLVEGVASQNGTIPAGLSHCLCETLSESLTNSVACSRRYCQAARPLVGWMMSQHQCRTSRNSVQYPAPPQQQHTTNIPASKTIQPHPSNPKVNMANNLNTVDPANYAFSAKLPDRFSLIGSTISKGTLYGVWAKTSSLPFKQNGNTAVHDPKVGDHDFKPFFIDGVRLLSFAPRYMDGNDEYLLMEVWLQPRKAGQTRVSLFQWHHVVSEMNMSSPTKMAVGPMRRSDVKLPSAYYILASGDEVPHCAISEKTCWPKLTLMNSTKFVLQVDWEGMDGLMLIGGRDE